MSATGNIAAVSDVTIEGVRDRERGEQKIRWNVTTIAKETSDRRPGGNALADDKDTFSAGGARDVLSQRDSRRFNTNTFYMPCQYNSQGYAARMEEDVMSYACMHALPRQQDNLLIICSYTPNQLVSVYLTFRLPVQR